MHLPQGLRPRAWLSSRNPLVPTPQSRSARVSGFGDRAAKISLITHPRCFVLFPLFSCISCCIRKAESNMWLRRGTHKYLLHEGLNEQCPRGARRVSPSVFSIMNLGLNQVLLMPKRNPWPCSQISSGGGALSHRMGQLVTWHCHHLKYRPSAIWINYQMSNSK